jgi:hypothetical protein
MGILTLNTVKTFNILLRVFGGMFTKCKISWSILENIKHSKVFSLYFKTSPWRIHSTVIEGPFD